MNNKLLLTLLSLFLSMAYSHAQLSKTIDVTTPGTLSVSLGVDKTKVTELILTGTINDADFATIKQMSLLKNLDMSGVDIVNSTIPASAFAGRVMDRVVLPTNLEVIGLDAFRWSNMSEIKLPSSLKTIKSQAFRESTIGSLDFSECNSLESLGNFAFSFGNYKTGVDFTNCTSLKSIGSYCFESTISQIVLPKNLVTLDALSFAKFRGIAILPSTLEAIGLDAFRWSSMNDIKLPSSLKTIGVNAFRESTIGSLDFSECNSLESLGNFAFSFGNYKTGVDFTNCTSLKSIGSYCFESTISQIVLPKNLVTLDALSFAKFRGIAILPSTLETIGSEAFRWSTIKDILLPKSLNFIGSSAFQECSQLSQITSLNPIPPTLGTNVFFYVNKTTCKLIVPEGSLSLYQAALQWKDFLMEEEKHTNPTPSLVDLYYTEDSGATTLAEYKGVRIGEYYWMNTPFQGNHIALNEPGWSGDYAYLRPWRQDYKNSMTVENVNLLHSRLLMFENARLVSNQKSYFDQLLPGASNNEKMVEFEKYYGTYYSRGHIQWMYDARPWVKLIVEGANKEDKKWDLPVASDIRQLLAMCGNATMHEVRQYLSYGYDQADAPSVAKVHPEDYFDWFSHNPFNFKELSNGFIASNTNKYSFGMCPSGSKLHDPGPYSPLTQADANVYVIGRGQQYPYQGKRGDFAGLNQTFALSLHGAQSFILHDYPEIRSEKTLHWSPIRWCRQMTNDELGYKLYINQPNFFDTRESLVALKSRIGNGETILIKKLALDQQPEAGFVELPRGYLRGFYVQYILDKATPEKTIPQIVDIALQSLFIWGANNAPAPEVRVAKIETPEASPVTIYPNPVTNTLYFDSSEAISGVQIYSTNGKVVLNQTNVGSSIDVSQLTSGTYVLKLQVEGKTYTHKMIKK